MRFIFLISGLFLWNIFFAQQNEVTVRALVVDENNNPIPFTDIAFRRLQIGFSSDKNGYFTAKILPSDSLLILKKGHVPTKLSFKDSIQRSEYVITLVLPRTPLELTEVQISAIRSYQQIRQEINKIYIRQTDINPDAKLLTNPLSYLYELLSSKEKEKRFSAQLEAEEAKRIVLKDLFRLYNNYNIIDLEEEEYDRFISYLNMPYEFLQRTSDYDLAVSIKRMYAGFSRDKGSSFRKHIYPAALDDLQRIKNDPGER